MERFTLDFTLSGRAVVEADDREEAETLLVDGLGNLDASMFEEVDIYAVEVEPDV